MGFYVAYPLNTFLTGSLASVQKALLYGDHGHIFRLRMNVLSSRSFPGTRDGILEKTVGGNGHPNVAINSHLS